ncbi:MAG: M15 family metallopeptidase [Treponema sp.]|jgi:D-alanyl-D-alanine carboxypeptidase|nr:M15 family metallopeptidase [Treponema sp.]
MRKGPAAGTYAAPLLLLLGAAIVSCGGRPSERGEPVKSAEERTGAAAGDSAEGGGESEGDLAEAIVRLSAGAAGNAGITQAGFPDHLRLVLEKAELPGDLSLDILAAASENPAFILDFLSCLEGDPFLRRLVDKQHPLPPYYEPDDLVPLRPSSYETSRGDLRLRQEAAGALEEMAASARDGGVVLVVSSSYRSYDYQAVVYARNVQEMGQENADRESSRPGFSQHQTGFAADFGSITDAFAETEAGLWMAENAGRFGWSLSFPAGYEEVTGYRWESWHFRYVGKELAAFIDNYFGGIQQYALRFIHEWEAAERTVSSAP